MAQQEINHKMTDTNTSFVARLAMVVAISGVLVFGGLAGCASSPSRNLQATDVVAMKERAAQRAGDRWKALIDKRFEESFAFLSEASRAGYTAAEYAAAMRRQGILAATVEDVQCQEQICSVRVRVSLPVAVKGVGRRLQSLPVEEQWVLTNGELWLIRK